MVIYVTAFPYAIQNGTVEVPDDIPKEDIRDYLEDHWDDIMFDSPDLDYSGTDFVLDYDE